VFDFHSFDIMRVACLVAAVAIVAACGVVNTDENEGDCGDNVHWELKDDGMLRIFGTGEMKNYPEMSQIPWKEKRSSIKSVVIENGVTSIGECALSYCGNITKVTIPDTLESIGPYAFNNCSSLSNVTFGQKVKSIGNYAFHLCSNLVNVIIPDSVTFIGMNAFSSCYSLKTVIFGDGLATIGSYAFFNCTSLSDVTIPDSVTTIEKDPFQDCTSLKSVFYQGSQQFDSSAFKNCNSLDSVCVSPGYNSASFCGKDVNSTSDICAEFRSLFNSCYKGAYIDGKFTQQKTKNATDWENKRSHGCVKYQCDNETGLSTYSMCKYYKDPVCVDDECVESKTLEDKEVVIIELNEAFDVTDLDYTEVLNTLNELSKVDVKVMKLGLEINEEYQIVRLLVYVDDADSAEIIAKTLEEMKKGEECQHGMLCNTKDVHVKRKEQIVSELSRASSIHGLMKSIFIMLIITMMEEIII